MPWGRTCAELARGQEGIYLDLPTGRPGLRACLDGQDRPQLDDGNLRGEVVLPVPEGSPETTSTSGPMGVEVPELSRPDLNVRVGRCDGQLSAFWGIQPGQDSPVDGTWEPIGNLNLQQDCGTNWTFGVSRFEGLSVQGLRV